MRLKLLLAILFLGFAGRSNAQLLQWNTFGNVGTETTEPSVFNNANISAANLTQGTITPAVNANRFGGSNWWNAGNTVAGNTIAEAVAGNDYMQFIVTPNGGYSFTPTSLAFGWDRSSTGPQSVTLRSSVDGFTSDLGSVTGMAAALTTGNTISISGLTNITTATTFRLYGYGATATTGTGGFDVASNVVTVQLSGTTTLIPTGITSAQSGDWYTGSTWIGGVVPTNAQNVIINHAVTATVGVTRDAGTTTTISVGASLAMTGATYTNNGTTTINGRFRINNGSWATGSNFVYGAAGILDFFTNGNYAVNASDVFWPVTNGPYSVNVLQAGLVLNASRTVNGIFSTAVSGAPFGIFITSPAILTLNGTCRIDAGGFFNNAPVFGPSSTLVYNSGGVYGRGFEWSALGVGTIGTTPGYPNNVQTSTSGTQLNYTNGTPLAKAMAGNLTVDFGTAFFMDYGFTPAGGALTVAGNVTVAGTLSLGYSSGDDLKMAGNLAFTGSGSLVSANRAIYFTKSSGTQTISSALPLTIHYIVFDSSTGSRTVQLLAGTILTVSAPATGNAISFGNAADIFDINGNTLNVGTIGLANTITGLGTFKGSASSNLTIRGLGSIGNIGFTTGFENLGTFNTDREAGLISCVLTSQLTINTSLTLTHGLINLANNTMTLAAVASVALGGAGDSYVIADTSNGANATMRKVFSVAGTFTYPIGDKTASLNGSEYSPITVTFMGGTYGGYAGFAVNDIKEPNLDANTDFISRYWDMTSSGIAPSTYDLNATYYSTDVNGTEINTRSNQWNGSVWLNNGTPSAANTLSISGVTSLPATNHFTKGFRNADINVQVSAVNYLTGSTYNFGNVPVASSNSITFTIQNIGQQSLTMGAATFSGNPNYSYTTAYTSPVSGPSGTTTFVVTFTPSGLGTFTGSISIPNNDPFGGENPYIVNFTGVGVVAAPDINIQGLGQTINPGNTPLFLDGSLFVGQVVATTSAPNTFTIQNLGNVNLNITSVVLGGANAGDFNIASAPASSVLPSSSTTFTITFTPTIGGQRTATITLASNDPDEATYTFNIGGTGQEPEIEVYGFGNSIPSGSVAVNTSNSTQFGNVNVTSGSTAKTFTIFNTGALSLTLSGVTLSGSGAANFAVTTMPVSPLATSVSTILVITFDPSSIGVKDATVTIPNNDNNENPYTFAIQGNGIDYIECGLGAYQTIAVQDFEVVPATPTMGYSITLPVAPVGTALATNGTAYGASRSVVSNKFIGSQSFQVAGFSATSATEKTTVIDFSTVDVSAFQNIALNFKVGAYSTNTIQGVDGNPEKVIVYISKDNGLTYSKEMDIAGNNNSIWDINSSTGIASTSYDGNNITTVFAAAATSTNTGFRDITINNLPNVTQLKIRISVTLDRTDELWVIDDVKLQGKTLAISTWNGSTWSAGVPTSSTKAIFAGAYNTTPTGSVQSCACQINPTVVVNVNSGTYLEVQSDLVNSGTLNIDDDASLVQVNNNAVNSGSINVTKTTSAYNKFDYTYWSSPVTSATIGGPFSLWRTDYAFQFVTANYADVVAPLNGFDDDNNAWQNVTTATVMTPGKGYAIMAPTTGAFPATSTVTFSGAVNNGIISIPLALSGNGASNTDDFNLIGNPYPSAIYANAFINTNLNFAGTLYFWTHRTGISGSNPGPDANNFITTDYAMYNLSGGTSSGSGSPVPTGYVASGQGFFIDAQAPTSVVFNNSMRNKTYNNSNFYRNSINQVNAEEVTEKDRIWLNLENGQGLFSQQLIGYFENATEGFDRGYDGVVNPSANSISFYSLLGNDDYRIQGRGTFYDTDLIPLGYSSAVAGNYTISIDHAEGQLANVGTSVFLEDKLLNIVHDLKQAPYLFATGIGATDDRFLLRYSNASLGLNPAEANENAVIAFNDNGQISIKSKLEQLKSVNIHDVLGRLLYSNPDVDGNDLKIDNLRTAGQALIISVVTESGNKVTKKIIF